MKLGEKIRAKRQEKGLRIEDLSQLTGITAGYLSQVERDLTNPTVATLVKISSALGVPVASFFEGADVPYDDHVLVVRREQRKKIVYPGSEIVNELVTPDLRRKLEILWISAPPGSSSRDESWSHEGEECGLILSGCMEISVGDNTYVLHPGDSIYYDSSLPHCWRSLGNEELRAIWIVTPPSF